MVAIFFMLIIMSMNIIYGMKNHDNHALINWEDNNTTLSSSAPGNLTNAFRNPFDPNFNTNFFVDELKKQNTVNVLAEKMCKLIHLNFLLDPERKEPFEALSLNSQNIVNDITVHNDRRTLEKVVDDMLMISEAKLIYKYKTSDISLYLKPEVKKRILLKTLYLASNSFIEFPMELCYLTTLENIDLRQNPINKLPQEILHLKQLKSLIIDWHLVTQLPFNIRGQLQMLDKTTQDNLKVIEDKVERSDKKDNKQSAKLKKNSSGNLKK